MKKINIKRLITSALTLFIVSAMVIPASAAVPVKVELGTTSTYAVLAGSAITNTGPTTISGDAGGDVGIYPGSSFTDLAGVTLSGTVHIDDAAAIIAKADLETAYDDAAGRTPVTIIPTELGGTTLTPGVYASTSGTFEITGTLTLDAQGDPDAAFIFQTVATLITADGSLVVLENEARYCRVFWQVGSSATLGIGSTFVGHIFALTSITANNGAVIQGQLLARNGAVTLNNNIITNGICADTVYPPIPPVYPPIPPVYPPLINVIKTPNPLALAFGGGMVTYTYQVTNPGMVVLTNVSVTDDKVSPVSYVSGDVNSDNLLQPGETWLYTGATTLSVTTTNTATAQGRANGMTAIDIAIITVVVQTPTPVVETITGGTLPNTSSPWQNVLFVGAAFVGLGAVRFSLKKRHE